MRSNVRIVLQNILNELIIQDQRDADDRWKSLSRWSEEALLDCKRYWLQFEDMKAAHDTHSPVLTCSGCSLQYCEHMTGYVCVSYGVCADCDRSYRPNPYNPKNRDLVAYYGIQLP